MSGRRLRSIVLASALTLPGTAFAQVQVNQIFNEQGPAPSSGPFCVIGSGDAVPKGINCGVGPGQNPLLFKRAGAAHKAANASSSLTKGWLQCDLVMADVDTDEFAGSRGPQ